MMKQCNNLNYNNMKKIFTLLAAKVRLRVPSMMPQAQFQVATSTRVAGAATAFTRQVVRAHSSTPTTTEHSSTHRRAHTSASTR